MKKETRQDSQPQPAPVAEPSQPQSPQPTPPAPPSSRQIITLPGGGAFPTLQAAQKHLASVGFDPNQWEPRSLGGEKGWLLVRVELEAVGVGRREVRNAVNMLSGYQGLKPEDFAVDGYYTIIIGAKVNPMDYDFIPVSVNGEHFDIPREMPRTIPGRHLRVLLRARYVQWTQQPGQPRKKGKPVARFAFTLVGPSTAEQYEAENERLRQSQLGTPASNEAPTGATLLP